MGGKATHHAPCETVEMVPRPVGLRVAGRRAVSLVDRKSNVGHAVTAQVVIYQLALNA